MNGELLVFKIWELCKAQGMTKTEFYEKAGISPSAIAHYKSGTNKPSVDTLIKFAEILDVDPSYLLCELDGEKEKDPTSENEGGVRGTVKRILDELPDELMPVVAAKLIEIKASQEKQ